LDRRGTKPLLRLFKKLGGFPLIDGLNWHEDKWSINDLTLKYPNIYYLLFYFAVGKNNVSVVSSVFPSFFTDDYVRIVLRELSNNHREIEEIINVRKKFIRCWHSNEECESFGNTVHNAERNLLIEPVVNLKYPCDDDQKGCFRDLLPKDIDWDNVKVFVETDTFFRLWKLLQIIPKRFVVNFC
jgi:hypothetical protein